MPAICYTLLASVHGRGVELKQYHLQPCAKNGLPFDEGVHLVELQRRDLVRSNDPDPPGRAILLTGSGI